MLGCGHVVHHGEGLDLLADHLAGEDVEMVVDIRLRQAVADARQHDVHRRIQAGVVAPLVATQVVGAVLDLLQRGLHLGGRQAGEGQGEQGILLGQAEQVRGDPLVLSHQAVQEDGLPGVFVHRPSRRMWIGQVSQFGVALPALDPGCIHAANVRIEHRE